MSEHEDMTMKVRIRRVAGEIVETTDDLLAVEEPLEIRVAFRGEDGVPVSRGVSVTMRTPGDDEGLAAGFLATEGILSAPDELAELSASVAEDVSGHGLVPNVVRAVLSEGVKPDLERLSRHVFTSSSCGVCGKATLEALANRGLARLSPGSLCVSPEVLRALPASLLERQKTFSATGGLHAAALADADGNLVDHAEDVGRHNAMDKLLGRRFLEEDWPLADHFVLVSGRASFELVQKALVAGVPMLAAVGAPSSLAVELADNFGMTLVGFLSAQRFNVYCRAERVGE